MKTWHINLEFSRQAPLQNFMKIYLCVKKLSSRQQVCWINMPVKHEQMEPKNPQA